MKQHHYREINSAISSPHKPGHIRLAFLGCTLLLCSQFPITSPGADIGETVPWDRLKAEARVIGKPDWRPMLAYLAELHEKSTHPAQPPFPYPWEEIGPGYPHRVFGHWDIVHEALDVMAALPEHAREQILDDLVNQQPDGLIPGSIYMDGKPEADGNTARFSKKAGHPPLWPLAIQEYSDMTGSTTLIAQCYEPLARQIAWFEQNRRAGAGFFYSRSQWESGIDDDLRERFARPNGVPQAALDATCHVFILYDLASIWAKQLGKDGDSPAYRKKAEQLRHFLQNDLYDPQTGNFYDSWSVHDSSKRVGSFVGIWPLVAGAATPEQAQRVINEHLLNPNRFFSAHPISTIALSSPDFEPLGWRGTAWNSMSLWAAKGCVRYRRPDVALQILEKALDDTAQQFGRTGTIWEFYHPQRGSPEDLKRETEPPQGMPHRDYLGHNPLFAMARLYDQLAFAHDGPRNVIVYSEPSAFCGWPANYGVWSWGNEILVGFRIGPYQEKENKHSINNDLPAENVFARSLDGGLTWSIEKPENINSKNETKELSIPLSFQDPGFALRCQGGEFNFSYDRGRTWSETYKLPKFGQQNIMARTDYVVNGSRDCLIFLTASKTNGKEGRPFCARTTDGGKMVQFVSWISPEPEGFSIMPSTVRISHKRLVSAIRRKEQDLGFIEVYTSSDDGQTWQLLSKPAITGNHGGNPPSMVKLTDGRIVLTYGCRSAPFGIRARISSDAGKTWDNEIHLRDDGRNWDFGYPRTVVRPDGKLVTIYYFTTLKHKEQHIAATIWNPDQIGLNRRD
jgi:putative isomerase